MTRDRVLPTGRRTAVQRRELLTLAAMCLGVMMTFLLITATISALSAIQADLHVSPSALMLAHATTTCLIFPAADRQPAHTRQHVGQGTSPTS
ncbi:hypothetical protein [Streptomyces purpurascens]|uniref:Uncharacterized protein n=1 Tax=Streptomyces purpurascens TaxID=1924 RepID=A0ABZ1MFC8_STREF|nr:hypothetical protein [Streptomyces purpurascens]MCE7047827.1 hypothetical protein [Streptomyces purpurascens]GHA17199.1 hypothetical protein GCM10010303_29050 [Streptomyces purpurascens]